MIKIYGHPQTSAGRCFWVLEEIGLAYEHVAVSMQDKEHKSKDFLAKNPNGKVPCLEDGDLVLWESMAINHYLAEKYQPQLFGKDLIEKAKTVQWSYWSIAEYQRPMIDLFIQMVFVPEGRKDEALMQKSRDRILPMNQILDAHLDGKNHMVGEDFTLADLHVASVAKLNSAVNIDLSQHKSLDLWLNRVLERPAHMKAQALG